MELKIPTFTERSTYSGANALAFTVTVIAVITLAATADNLALVLLVAALSGLWLAARSRLTYDLMRAADRWIGPLVSMAVLCGLLAALAESWLTLLGAATLLFVCWLPYMAAEWAGQALRSGRTCRSPRTRRGCRRSPRALSTSPRSAAPAVLPAAATGDGRLAAALVMPHPFCWSARQAGSGLSTATQSCWPGMGSATERTPALARRR